MPKAELPKSFIGWLVAIGAGIVGFLCGFVFIALATRMIG